MRSARVWKRLLGVEHTVVEQVVFDEDADAVVAMVRPTRSRRRRCAVCQRRCSGYDQGEAGAAGVGWTLAWCGCSWRPTRPGFVALPMG